MFRVRSAADPTKFSVVHIGAIHCGTAGNIIPDDVVLSDTVRSFKGEVRAKMLAVIERTAKVVAANASEPEIKITEVASPAESAAVTGGARCADEVIE
jgi:metal-dependent amidase/aminoacylase/carboxypeptidase family protein